MKRSFEKNGSTHEEHPVRNFFYFIYTLINAAAFLGVFYGESVGMRTLSIPSIAVLALAVLVGVVDAMRRRKK